MAKPNSKRAQKTQELFADAVGQLGGDTPATAPAPIEKANAVRGRRVLPWRRDEMELWELDPRKSRTRKQILDMAKSLAAGQDVPIIARYHPDPEKRKRNIVQILAGGTRWEAAAPELADKNLLDVDLRDVPDDREALKLAWRTNTQHNDHTAIDNALYFRQLLQMEGIENPAEEPTDSQGVLRHEASLRKVGAENGISKDRVAQYVALLKLPKYILDTFAPAQRPVEGEEEGEHQNDDETPRVEWNEKHGRALLKLQEYPDEQKRLFLEIRRDKLSGNTALARADRLEEDARKDAGLSPKPKKTRNSKAPKKPDQPAAEEAPTEDPPAEEPIAEQPAADQAPTPPVVTPAVDTTDTTPPVTSGTAGAEQGSSGTTSRSLTLGAGPSPVPAPEPRFGVVERFAPAVESVVQFADTIQEGPLTTEEARRARDLSTRLRQAAARIDERVSKALQEELLSQ